MALSRDVPPLLVMPVVADGTELALWRSASGRLAAWADRCPHRGMRLSHGFVRGEALSCIYHGWSYGASGQCQRIPAHPDLDPPDTIRVPVHRATEQGGIIWVATAGTDGMPPDLAGFVPVRSIPVEAGADAVLALAGLAGDGVARGTIAGVAVAVAVQAAGAGCVLHVLAEDAGPDALRALSRELEGLRRQAEARGQAA